MNTRLYVITAVALVFFTGGAAAQDRNGTESVCSAEMYGQFPQIQLEDITGTVRSFPDTFPQEGALAILSFKRRHGPLSKEWSMYLLELGIMPPGEADASYKIVLVGGGVPEFVRPLIKKELQEQIPADYQPYYFLLFEDSEKLVEQMTIPKGGKNEDIQVVRIYRDGTVESLACGKLNEMHRVALQGLL